ncbi:bifunctional acetate--CoA ligase family protein/GNAT family N-acetyltransferase [Cupriavidus sp. WKF15]|uniref:bifunctional acetate--CoA ligase family protein/GNAT family N-acetyltransferase n=1 Tax=Cupriavidus sp. WKF15 TaxID=3032282 RepID=UPI0023E1B241|nr:bifunctional acetate--CoA ligase family protein/GNAT family N-acetyltransferase [Cupriavidus sp. WKF15]WER44682.1 bifunctional acetate--CoA ligase family protein/GNAT family N-acetyltransferase [Cupriavidus sp. WKF15]
MSIRNLESLFRPRSVAVIGATERPHSVGATVLANLRNGGFAGAVLAVNPKYRTLGTEPCYPAVDALPCQPDLAVICTPPATVPALIEALGRRGTRAAIVLSTGLAVLANQPQQPHEDLRQQMLDAARPYLLRILGPNCIGLISPTLGLNASFAPGDGLPGTLAFATQSGALATAVLDWARPRQIGFSHFISLGDSADVDVADVLDYLSGDPGTRAILLYVEAIRNGRRFMSAARAAARSKPIVIVKAGRAPEGARAAASHTGALAGRDDIYDAAIRRAGMLRVASTEDLFDAVETLARARPVYGNRLAIITNGGGAGVMATDALIGLGGKLATLTADRLAVLDGGLPPTWSRANPIDIIGDAPVTRYLHACDALSRATEADAVLLLHAPTAIVPSDEIATAVVSASQEDDLPLFTSWLGGDSVVRARQLCRHAGIPTYDTPEQAVMGFLQAAEYRRNQQLLMQTPPSVTDDFQPDRQQVRDIVDTALAQGRAMLSEQESKAILAAYGIPIVQTLVAPDADGAAALAISLGFPVALKIDSPDITHKSDVGGVLLDLPDAAAVRAAARTMSARISCLRPTARLAGFTVQPMANRNAGIELIVGMVADLVFGPVILFGHGGTAVSQIRDHAIGLPPLNTVLAAELVQRTRVACLLAGYRDKPSADLEALNAALVRVSALVCDVPEIAELDINPLLAGPAGVLALDARIGIHMAQGAAQDRLAILPYPKELEERITWNGTPLMLRPIRPEDEPAMRAFFEQLTSDDIHTRYFCSFRDPGHPRLARMTQIDYAREMSLVAVSDGHEGGPHILGEVRAAADPDNAVAELGVVVRSDCQGKGLGTLLLQRLIATCRARGTRTLEGYVLSGNRPMLDLARRAGFSVSAEAGADAVRIRLELGRAVAPGSNPGT